MLRAKHLLELSQRALSALKGGTAVDACVSHRFARENSIAALYGVAAVKS